MHEWAAVNGWSRPETKAEYGRFSVNIPVISSLPKSGYGRYSKKSFTPKPDLQRCHTTVLGQATFMEKQQVYKPRQEFNNSSTVRYIKYLEGMNKVGYKKVMYMFCFCFLSCKTVLCLKILLAFVFHSFAFCLLAFAPFMSFFPILIFIAGRNIFFSPLVHSFAMSVSLMIVTVFLS